MTSDIASHHASRFARRHPLRSARAYSEWFRRARDPLSDVASYRAAILSAARARQHVLSAGSSSRLEFALTLLQLRVRASQRHLRRSSLDTESFAAFLHVSRNVTLHTLDTSETLDELAEATIAAADDLHSYLLTHGLVEAGYQEAENALVAWIASADPQVDPEPEPPAEFPAGAAKNDLALAA